MTTRPIRKYSLAALYSESQKDFLTDTELFGHKWQRERSADELSRTPLEYNGERFRQVQIVDKAEISIPERNSRTEASQEGIHHSLFEYRTMVDGRQHCCNQ
jgi:hypothetical protein